jgi:hypothetical protein
VKVAVATGASVLAGRTTTQVKVGVKVGMVV